MDQLYFKVKVLREGAKVPSKREEDAAYDIYGLPEDEFVLLRPGDLYLMPTGFAMEIPKHWVLYIAERGSSGSKGFAKRCGVVDSGYRGEVFVVLNNTSNKPIVYAKEESESYNKFLEENNLTKEEVVFYPHKKGIAQGMLLPVGHTEVEVVQELDDTSERGEGKLGSSGK